jgi:NAD(P)H dehydrogenase (quinone)
MYRHLYRQYVKTNPIGTLIGEVAIPLFSDSQPVSTYLSLLDLPASKQMLIYRSNSDYAVDNTEHDAFYNELKNKGVDIRIGDYGNYSSLIMAFRDVDKLLFVSGNDVVARGKQYENVVKAAKEVGIKHIIYTGFERKDETDSSPLGIVAKAHTQTEKDIKDSGMDYTIMRNNLYMDIIPGFIGENVLETGIFYPAGSGKMACAMRSEMSEAAANILIGTGHENKEYVISNSVNYSFGDIASILSELSGKQITCIDPALEVFIETLVKTGIPKENAIVIASFATAIKSGEFYVSHSDLEMLLGRKPVSMNEFLKSTYSSINQ